MSTALEQPWTEERFLAWVGHQDRRYEFDGSRPVAMTGGNNRHATLTRNLMIRGVPAEDRIT